MLFIFSAILVYFITMPGVYLLLRAKLCKSIVEALSAGFFFGFSLITLFYLGFSRILPVGAIDAVVIATSLLALVLSIKEIGKQQLPVWIRPVDYVQVFLVSASLLFLTTLAFGDLAGIIDDDAFIHLPNIKRVSAGDIPPHMPYFPECFLRNHTGRVMFVGTIGRFLHLEPELAAIYVTLAVCPAFIFMFHAFALRLGKGRRLPTAFCFFGLLFLVSFALEPVSIKFYSIRAGAITYVWNNNIFAFSHAVFIAWLIGTTIERLLSQTQSRLTTIRQNKLVLLICMLAYAGLYFVYISNFLMFSLLLAALPIVAALINPQQRVRSFFDAALYIGVIVGGMLLVHLIVSPFLLERIGISLGLIQTSEPLGFTQQAHLSFPKKDLFSITNPQGQDMPFITWRSLTAQGLSFYIGLAGLFYGFVRKKYSIAVLSLFGWLALIWQMTVDMGEYKAETLRLMLVAHMAFGAVTGLMIGLALDKFNQWSGHVPEGFNVPPNAQRAIQVSQFLLVGLSIALCGWMAWGNVDKFVAAKHWNVKRNIRKMIAIHKKDPESWNSLLKFPKVDFEVDRALASMVHKPSENVMLRVKQDDKFADGNPICALAPLINAASITGAGMVGICHEHGPPYMGKRIFPWGYRASLFWEKPSSDLLNQLAPNWIVVDPTLVSAGVLEKVLKVTGITKVLSFADESGRKRILMKYNRFAIPSTKEGQATLEFDKNVVVQAKAFKLIELPVKVVSAAGADKVKPQMVVYSKEGDLANAMDMPIVGIEKNDKDEYKMYFVMIQSGQWLVSFVDPQTQRPLHDSRITVKVAE